MLGDFNAKTDSGWKEFPENVGRYGKGHTNENGLALLEFLSKSNLVLTNTLFPHKLSHRTTWTAPEISKGIKKYYLDLTDNPEDNLSETK